MKRIVRTLLNTKQFLFGPYPKKAGRWACLIYYMPFNGSALLYREAKALKDEGYEVDVVCLRNNWSDPMFVSFDDLNLLRIQSRPFREKRASSYLFNLWIFLLKSALALSILQLRKRYEVVHVTAPPDILVFTAILPKMLGARIILDIHDIGPELYMRKLNVPENGVMIRFLKAMEKLSIAFSDHVITVTDIWRDKIISRSCSADKCTVLLNVPDDQLFNTSITIEPGKKNLNLFYHGSLEEHFGVDTLLKAMPRIVKAVPNVCLHIYGAGRLLESFQEMVAAQSMNGEIQFHSSVPFYELPAILQAADIGVVPTKDATFSDEALSMKSLEYISMGIPIVISANSAHRYYYDDSMVKFFTPNDERSLADAVIALCLDSDLRRTLSSHARTFIEKHSWRTCKTTYLKIIDGVVDGRKG